MNLSNYKNAYNISAIMMTMIAVIGLIYTYFHPIYNYYFIEVAITSILLIIIEWSFLLIKDKRTPYIRDWYENFISKNQNEFIPYIENAKKALKTFILCKVIILQIYFVIMILCLFNFFITLDSCYLLSDILLEAAKFYLYIILIFFMYTFINLWIHKKYYFVYLEPKSEYHTYLLMTHYLLQLKNACKIYLNYHDLINTSASLTRILKFEDSYEFLKIWRTHLKKMNPIFSFVYIEHCIFDFVMLKRSDDVELAYQDYNANLVKNKKYIKDKNVEKCTYLVDILYAYHKEDYQRVVDLYQRYHLYFKETDYKDSHQYILYQSYLHIDEAKALEIYNNNKGNLFFKEGV